ncbi:MAG TPA: hypothetical protein DCR72_12445 [Pseudomonas sp.]|nr:hypothetical protein [Pseudomonas sp.]
MQRTKLHCRSLLVEWFHADDPHRRVGQIRLCRLRPAVRAAEDGLSNTTATLRCPLHAGVQEHFKGRG